MTVDEVRSTGTRGPRGRPGQIGAGAHRSDFNVPIRDGEITDDLRIRAALPTLNWLASERGASGVTACTHLGRPKGKPDPQFSVQPVVGQRTPRRLAPGVRAARQPAFRPR